MLGGQESYWVSHVTVWYEHIIEVKANGMTPRTITNRKQALLDQRLSLQKPHDNMPRPILRTAGPDGPTV